MKLNEFFEKPIKEHVQDFNVVGMKPITDDDGNLVKLIVEYTPNNHRAEDCRV